MFRMIAILLVCLGIFIGVKYSDEITELTETDAFEQVQDKLEDMSDNGALEKMQDTLLESKDKIADTISDLQD